jgi:SAM-dependent methyltransferase
MSATKSEQTLFDAAIESARIFNWAVTECAASGQLLEALGTYSSHAEIMRRMNFHESKAEAVRSLLNVLVDTGVVEQRTETPEVIYRSRAVTIEQSKKLDGALRQYEQRHSILDPWYGDAHAELIRSSNRALIGENLSFFRSPTVKIRFDRTFFDAWRTNLLNPLYEFGRLQAVREMVQHGSRFLDLGSGLGYGAQRLAEYKPEGCEITCIDISADMLAEARMLAYPGAKVRFIQHDLNKGLPKLSGAPFDAVLFNGAFHFISDKRAQLREIYEVLRPHGLLVIGHCFCRSGFPDEPMHDLYFSLLENGYWAITFQELRALVKETGFAELREFHRGSHSYLLAERLPNKLICE